LFSDGDMNILKRVSTAFTELKTEIAKKL
jgi:hypothetical protein